MKKGQECKTTAITDKKSDKSNIRAAIYESTDKKEDGGIIHTRIYCFQTNQPILKNG